MLYSGLALIAGFDGSLVAAETGAAVSEVTVTATREAQRLAETAASVGVIGERTIAEVKPGHPSEIMERIPGVHVNVTGGEGHMTAIRQPITTKPLYLYLEDGIPTRSTGFFNHNALYEINLPQAGGVEVMKGPGSALYGSDAIAAVINVETRPSPLVPEANATVEAGGYGWRRLLGTAGNTWGDDGLRVDLNLTHTDGWREATGYDRQAGTLRWDRMLAGGATLKTVLSGSSIDQQTAGSSRLLADDYHNNPTLNYTPISYRKVKALRLSTAWEKETANRLISITPYLRDNSMDMLPNWSLSYDPVKYETQNWSIGALLKYRQDFTPYRTRFIVGLDLDHSPGSRYEQQISPTRVGNVYTNYTVVGTLYDYDVTYQAASPYVHLALSPVSRLRLSMGLRYDYMEYDYRNKLGTLTTGVHIRPASTRVDFSDLTPKLGATWAFSERLSGFVSYREGFRAPSEGQLFRAGRNIRSVSLQPVKAESYELGLRQAGKAFHYRVSLYLMRLHDDILTYRDTTTGDRYVTNAGETRHRGIEIGAGGTPARRWTLEVAASYAKHTYESWAPRTGVRYDGNEMERAPRLIANTRLAWRPAWLEGGRIELEWVKLGAYWMDAANTYKYAGHDLLNLRVNWPVSAQLEWHARLMNLADERYATNASYSPAGWTPEKFEYAPGMPRTLYAGLVYRFR